MPVNPYDGNGYGCGIGYGYCEPAPSAAPLLLDNLPQFRIAVATKKLRTDYIGNCLQVRRSSDSTTDNFGFVDGVVDSAGYDAFCGAGSGFVASWYDQSGSGNNLTQATTTRQPRVVNAGTVEVNASGEIGIYGHAVNSAIDSGTLSYTRPFHRFAVVTFNGNADRALWDGQSDIVASCEVYKPVTNYIVRSWNGAGLIWTNGPSVAGFKAIVEVLNNGASSRVKVNDNSPATGNSGTGTMPTKVRLMNYGGYTTYLFDAWYHAFLDFDGELTTEQVTVVRDGLNELYGVF